MIEPNAVYYASELAEILEVSRNTIMKMFRDDKFLGHKHAGKWWILGADIIKMIESPK